MRLPVPILLAFLCGCGGFTVSVDIADTDSITGDDDDVGTTNPTNTTEVPGQAPTAADDFFDVDRGSSSALAVSANDADPEADIDPASILMVTLPGRGTAVPNGDGTIQYAHDDSDTPSDTFSYTISDMGGRVSNVATVEVTVLAVNQPPVANDDVAVVTDGEIVNIDLAGNDTDPDDGISPATAIPVAMPAHGTLIPLGDGTVDYTHSGDGSAYDSFTYTIMDYAGAESNEATVDITVNPAVLCAGWQYQSACWYTGLEGETCDSVCSGNCGFDQGGTQHTGNAVGVHFWPAKANGGNWVELECSSTDNDTNWGANGGAPDAFYSFGSCHLNCACNC